MQEPLVWYASYGSNMHPERFAVYLNGGTPIGGRRAAPGCRDRRPPSDVCAIEVPGGIFFATESLVWGGGRAFYDPELSGTTAMRAYLITRSQFSDVVAQEMYGRTGADLDLSEVLGRRQAHGWPAERVAQYLARAPGALGERSYDAFVDQLRLGT